MATKLSKKPQCVSATSYSCGYSCINDKKICRAEVSKANADAILKAIKLRQISGKGSIALSDLADKAVKAKTEPPIAETRQDRRLLGDLSNYETFSSKLVGSDDVSVGLFYDGSLPGVLSAAFLVNNKDKQGTAEQGNARRILRAVAGLFDNAIARLPDNAVIGNLASNTDSKATGRAKLYKRYGFGDPDPDNGSQWAIVDKGRLKPMSSDEAKAIGVNIERSA